MRRRSRFGEPIVLLSADGVGTNEIRRRTGKSKTCVWRWQERFTQEGFEGLLRDKTRPSRIAPLGAEVAARVVALTQTDPPAEATHWTATMMAKAAGISASSVQRIWRAHGLQPHRIRQFKLSNDPNFVDKLHDVVGIYVDPPEHAIVLSVDEKILACHEAGITVTLPKPQTSGAKSEGRFGKQDFAYLPKEDAYRCPVGSDCLIAIQTKKTAKCYGVTGPQPVKIGRSNRNARPGLSGGLRDGSMSISSKLCSSALMQAQKPCASVARRSSIRSAR
jgi:transposase